MVAGACSAVAGLTLFLILHALWILPIWFIVPIGLAIAVPGGFAIGWAYVELLPGLPRGLILRTIVVVGLVFAFLTPAFVLAEMRDPLFDVTDRTAVLSKPLSFAVWIFLTELLATAAAMGGILGWMIGRTRRAAAATALAGFAFALGPGHNIPLIGGTSGIVLEAKIMTPVIVLTATVLVAAHRYVERAGARP